MVISVGYMDVHDALIAQYGFINMVMNGFGLLADEVVSEYWMSDYDVSWNIYLY